MMTALDSGAAVAKPVNAVGLDPTGARPPKPSMSLSGSIPASRKFILAFKINAFRQHGFGFETDYRCETAHHQLVPR